MLAGAQAHRATPVSLSSGSHPGTPADVSNLSAIPIFAIYLPGRYLRCMSQKLDDLVGPLHLEEFGALPREEKLEQSLQKPELPGAYAVSTMKAITTARIRHQFANLIAAEMPNLQSALADLKKENPKVYIEKLTEVAEFALPRLKSVEVDVSANNESARSLTMDQLMAAIADDGTVVSVQ